MHAGGSAIVGGVTTAGGAGIAGDSMHSGGTTTAFHLQDSGHRVILRRRDGFLYQRRLVRRGPRAERPALQLRDFAVNGHQIIVRLPAAENHLRKTRPLFPLGVQPGESHVGIALPRPLIDLADFRLRNLQGNLPRLVASQNLLNIHTVLLTTPVPPAVPPGTPPGKERPSPEQSPPRPHIPGKNKFHPRSGRF